MATEYKLSYTASEINSKLGKIDGLASTSDVSGLINTHNTSTSAHNDIRLLIETLTTRLNTLADSDDTTLDQLSEIVAYIKSNKSLIEDVTTNKVNVSDIIDNLTTNVSNKPLSSAQGVMLKSLIDSLSSEITNLSNRLSTLESSAISVFSGAEDAISPDMGEDGDVYLVTE